MPEGSCFLSMIPVRSEPSGRSTMVNQLLYGDRVLLHETNQDWYRISSIHDNYEGWCETNQIIVTPEPPIGSRHYLLVNDTTATFTHDHDQITLTYGSSVPLQGLDYIIHEKPYRLISGQMTEPIAFSGSNLLIAAQKLMGVPYLWGGRSPFGIDCSGLIQIAFKMVGIQMPRDAWQQAEHPGEFIDLIDEAQVGDVAFFDNEEGFIKHVGILTGEGSIIHASGRVRVDTVDHQGIYNKELGRYTHKLRVIKRFGNLKS